MSDLTVKIIRKHLPKCYAVKNYKNGTWPSPWGPVAFGKYGNPIETTERRYGRNGRRFFDWLRFLCNDVDCSAELWVRSDAIEEWAMTQLEER